MIVVGNIILPNNTKFVGDVVFEPIRTPLRHGSSVVFTNPTIVTTDEDGDFSQSFSHGKYLVKCVVSKVASNPIRQFQITVPADRDEDETEQEVPFITCIDGAMEGDEDYGGGSLPSDASIATTTSAGIVKIDQATGDPVAVTTKTIRGADGMEFLLRPLAGKAYLLIPETGKYHRIRGGMVDGIPSYGIDETPLDFSELPTA